LFYFSCAGQGRESSEEFEIMFRKYEMDGWTIGRSEMNWARYKKNIFLWRMGIWFFGVWMVHWPALLCFFYFPRFATREFRLVCCLVAFMSYGWPAIFDSWVVWFTWYANIFEGRELSGDGLCGIIVCGLQTFMLWRIGRHWTGLDCGLLARMGTIVWDRLVGWLG